MKNSEHPGFLRCIAGGAIGAAVTVAVTLLLLLAACALLMKQGPTDGAERLAVGLCALIGGTVGGIISAKKGRGGALVSGVLTTLLSFLLLCLGGLLFRKELTFSEAGLVTGCIGAGTILGSFLGSGTGQKSKRHIRH